MSRHGRSFQVGPFHQSLKQIYNGGTNVVASSHNVGIRSTATTTSTTQPSAAHHNHPHHHTNPHHHPTAQHHQPLYHTLTHHSAATSTTPPYLPNSVHTHHPAHQPHIHQSNNSAHYSSPQQLHHHHHPQSQHQAPLHSQTSASSTHPTNSTSNNNNNANNNREVMLDAYGYPIVPYQPPQPVPFTSHSQPYQAHHHSRTVPHPIYDPPRRREEPSPKKKQPSSTSNGPSKMVSHSEHTPAATKAVINTTRSIGARLYRPSTTATKKTTVEHAMPIVSVPNPATRNAHQLNSNRINFSMTQQLSRSIQTSKNMLVEYENLDGLRKLGVIVSPHQLSGSSSSVSSSPSSSSVQTQNSSQGETSNSEKNNKWKLIDATGKSTIIDASQLTYHWPVNEMEKTSIGEDYVKELEIQCLNMAQQHQERAESIWKEFLSSRTAIQVTCEDIAEHLFHSQSPVSLYAAHKFLYANPLYFSCQNQHGKAVFECRSIREVENLRKIDGEERKLMIEEKMFMIKMANQLISLEPHQKFYASVKFEALQAIRIWQPDFTDSSADLSKEPSDSKFIKALKVLCLKQHPLADGSSSTYEKLLKPFAVYNSDASIMEFCMKLRLFDTPNIHLLRSAMNKTFPPMIQMVAEQMLKEPGPDLDKKYRRDLTHLRVFTIDSYPETVEIDDGVSLEITEDGTEYLYVHIADATRFMSFGSDMDKYASDTATSVYLPDKKIPMLPKELSTDLMSLSDARTNYVLTFKAKLLPDGEIAEYDVFPAIVNKVRKIDYDEADQILSNITSVEHTTYESLKRLMALANTRLRHRMKNGAFVSYSTPKPEIKVKGGGVIEVTRSKETSYSRRMIQECMIVANEVSAKFAADKGITIPFRATMGGLGGGSGVILDRPSEEEIENTINMITSPSETELISQILDNHESFKPVFGACVTQTPSWHNGIGVSAYTQATSPIRRYSDLLVHYQLKAGIRGDTPPLSWEDLEQLLVNLESTSKLVGNLQRKSERFWLFKYFQENMKNDKQYRALILDTKTDSSVSMRGAVGFVYLMEVGFKTNLYLTKKVARGDIIHVRVSQCDPFAGTIEFQ